MLSPVEMSELVFADRGVRPVLNTFKQRFVKVVSHKLDRLWRWDRRYLFQEFISVLSLFLWFIEEESLGLEVEYSFVVFVC